MDLIAANAAEASIVLHPLAARTGFTGLVLQLEPGFEAQVRPRLAWRSSKVSRCSMCPQADA